MSRVRWRPVFIAIFALAALAQVARVIDATGTPGAPPWQGTLGATTAASAAAFALTVTSVDPAGPSARAGLRQGDRIDIRANSLLERYFLFAPPLNGRPLVISVHRGSLQRSLTLKPSAEKHSWSFWLSTFAALWLLLFATLIGLRGADMPQMRWLSLWIATFVLTGALLNFASPWSWVYALLDISVSIVAPLSVAFLGAFAADFARPLSPLRRGTQLLCYACLAIFASVSFIGTAGLISLGFDPVPFINGNVRLFSVAAGVGLAIVSGCLAIGASRGIERQRAVWTLVPLAAFFAFYVAGIVATSASSPAGAVAIGIVSTLVLLAAPVALSYAALSRRLIDVGFFLNRAAVFAAVSAIVITASILVEWAAGNWLAGAAHTTSLAFGMTVALGLGFSMRYIHAYVERFIDRIFFRKRHEDESALRRFGHEASYISDRSTLLGRAERIVRECTGAVDAAIIVRDGAAAYVYATGDRNTTVSEDDPTIIALRAWNKPVDLDRIHDSALRGEFALPMMSRGTLVGALICGPKHDGEAYAPDLLDVLVEVAREIGTALAVFQVQEDVPNALILRELAELREDVKRLSRHASVAQNDREA